MGLFKPAWMNNDGKKASEAVEKITNQDELARAAQESQWYYVRKKAVEKLNDQVTLGYVAKNDKKFEIRVMAAEKLTDQVLACEMFDEMMRYNLGYQFKEEIEHKILARVNEFTDQKALANIAENYRCLAARKVAIEKLTDQNILTDIAKDHNRNFAFSPLLRLKVAEKLQNNALAQEILIDIAEKEVDNLGVLFEAAQKVNNSEISQKVFLTIFDKEYEKRFFDFGIKAAYLMKDKTTVIDKIVKTLQADPIPRVDRVLMFNGFSFDVMDKLVEFLEDKETEKQIKNREEVCAAIHSYNDKINAWREKENNIVDF